MGNGYQKPRYDTATFVDIYIALSIVHNNVNKSIS